MKRLLKNRSGTAEIVGTVLFLIILFFFFSNVFLWHNQVTREMDQVVADKTNSPVRIETTVLAGDPVHSNQEDIATSAPVAAYDPVSTENRDSYSRTIQESTYRAYPYRSCSLDVNYTFDSKVNTPEKMRLIADIRLSVYASYVDPNEPCFLYILNPFDDAWMDTGLRVMNGYRWSNITLSFPDSYIDMAGRIRIRFADASSQFGLNDTVQGTLNIDCMEVVADQIALEVTNLGGSDATLSRLWIVNATQTRDTQTDHVYADFKTTPDGALVAGGSTRTIVLSTETTFTGEGSIQVNENGDNLIVSYAPAAGQTLIFRVLTTLGNTAACSIAFPD
jgi:hypothetical protein